MDSGHSWYGCNYPIIFSGGCYQSWSTTDNYYYSSSQLNFNHSEGPDPNYDNYYGGWDNLTIDFDLQFSELSYGYDGNYDSPTYNQVVYFDNHYYAVWPTSQYEFTLYYQFVPVIPTE